MDNREIILRARPKSKDSSIKVYSGIMNKLDLGMRKEENKCKYIKTIQRRNFIG